MNYKRASIPSAFFNLIFCFDKYIKIAIEHNIAVTLEAKDILKKYEAGEYRPDLNEYESMARKTGEDLISSFKTSLVIVLAISCASLVIAYYSGTIDLSYDVSGTKICAFTSSMVAAWSALVTFREPEKSWKRQRLDEILLSNVLYWVLLPATLLAILSTLL